MTTQQDSSNTFININPGIISVCDRKRQIQTFCLIDLKVLREPFFVINRFIFRTMSKVMRRNEILMPATGDGLTRDHRLLLLVASPMHRVKGQTSCYDYLYILYSDNGHKIVHRYREKSAFRFLDIQVSLTTLIAIDTCWYKRAAAPVGLA